MQSKTGFLTLSILLILSDCAFRLFASFLAKQIINLILLKSMETTFDLPKVRGKYRFNVDLSKTTWFRVGGKAQILFLPKDADDLSFFLKNKPGDLAVTILGACSNVIIKDGGIEGVVIKLGREFAKINHDDVVNADMSAKIPDDKNSFISTGGVPRNAGSDTCRVKKTITIGAGNLCFNAALYTKINGLSGLEFLSSIPGNVGGAICMNAGCYDSDISKNIISATAIDFDGNILEISNKDFGFKYRGNSLPKNLIFVQGIFTIEQSTQKEVGAKIAEFAAKREASQPIRQKTGGSTFKNPDQEKSGGRSAWQLVDEAGCRGLKVGDAQVSEKHCNFMINIGEAKAQDLIDLGNLVIDKVKEKTGIELEWEIKRIGK
jgi:UDP-N-acetylmuramate dehydrogenase